MSDWRRDYTDVHADRDRLRMENERLRKAAVALIRRLDGDAPDTQFPDELARLRAASSLVTPGEE